MLLLRNGILLSKYLTMEPDFFVISHSTSSEKKINGLLKLGLNINEVHHFSYFGRTIFFLIRQLPCQLVAGLVIRFI